ncbi:MAG: ester cyclase [Planctomycetota bacterium]
MPTLTSQPQDTVRELIERGINGNDPSAVDDLVHSDYRYRTPTVSLEGPDPLKALFADYRKAFPDLEVVIDHQFAEDNQVCTRLTLRGTHLGPFNGTPGTGRKVNAKGVVISRIADGKIKEEWELIDELAVAGQLGLI